MKRYTHRTLVFLLAASLLAGGTVLATADDDDDRRDQELARQALSEGRIRPLTEIIESFKKQFRGEIVGVELETKGPKTFIYEFKALTPEGKLKEVKVDASTAKIIKIEDEDD